MKNKSLAIISLTFVFVQNMYAQDKKLLTLGDLWPKVEAHYPGLLAKQTAIEEARLKEKAVKSTAIPQLKAQAQNTYGTVESVSGAFFPQSGLFNVNGVKQINDESNTTFNGFASAVAEWDIYQFGKQKNANRAASLFTEKTSNEKDNYVLHLKKELSERYINLLYSDSKFIWSQKNGQRLNDIQKITAGLAKSGVKPAADSLLSHSSFIQALANADLWKGNRNAALIKLTELTDVPNINYELSVKRFIQKVPVPEKAIHSKDLKSHPFLKSLDNQRLYIESISKAEKGEALPTLKVLGGYAFRSSGINNNGHISSSWRNGFNNQSNNYLFGLGLTWNISNLYSKSFSAASLAKKAQQTEQLHQQYEVAMQSDIASLKAKINEQYQQLQKNNMAVKQSQQAYNMYLARYKSGLIALTELLQIQSLLEQAELNHIDASNQFWKQLAAEAELTVDFDFLFNNL
ncbi:TolC family protein [Pseudopedobacter sp.]|uniref:TolC family protein n=1 Tax=Pseudopedobacter sp. TaxID=1936787 RepID=UPI0033423FA4